MLTGNVLRLEQPAFFLANIRQCSNSLTTSIVFGFVNLPATDDSIHRPTRSSSGGTPLIAMFLDCHSFQGLQRIRQACSDREGNRWRERTSRVDETSRLEMLIFCSGGRSSNHASDRPTTPNGPKCSVGLHRVSAQGPQRASYDEALVEIVETVEKDSCHSFFILYTMEVNLPSNQALKMMRFL